MISSFLPLKFSSSKRIPNKSDDFSDLFYLFSISDLAKFLIVLVLVSNSLSSLLKKNKSKMGNNAISNLLTLNGPFININFKI